MTLFRVSRIVLAIAARLASVTTTEPSRIKRLGIFMAPSEASEMPMRADEPHRPNTRAWKRTDGFRVRPGERILLAVASVRFTPPWKREEEGRTMLWTIA